MAAAYTSFVGQSFQCLTEISKIKYVAKEGHTSD